MLAFDIETTGLQPEKCLVTVVCTQDYFTGERRVYEFARVREEIPEEYQDLVDDLSSASMTPPRCAPSTACASTCPSCRSR